MTFKHCFFASAILLSCIACTNDNTLPEPEPVIDPIEDAIDLSANEMANCYIVTEPGIYRFTADNQFNLGEGLPVPPKISPVSARLVWQTEKDLISSVELVPTEGLPVILFQVNKPKGNALIAACDEYGRILWSWHIWMPEVEITSLPTSTGYEVMNLNLGAINNSPADAASYGMLYQWGRKDPFPAAASLTGNTSTVGAPLYDIDGKEVLITNSSWSDSFGNSVQYAISHPTVCMSNYAHYSTSRDWLNPENSDDTLWGNPDGEFLDRTTGTFPNKGRKTCYDPSPAGWRVPPPDVFRNFTSSGGYAWIFGDFNVDDVNDDGIIDLNDYRYGWNFMITPTSSLYFPAAARFDGSYAMLMGSVSGLWGNYWSNSPYSSMEGGAFCPLAFQIKDQNGNEMITVSPAAASSRADAFSIRCIRQ